MKSEMSGEDVPEVLYMLLTQNPTPFYQEREQFPFNGKLLTDLRLKERRAFFFLKIGSFLTMFFKSVVCQSSMPITLHQLSHVILK